MIDPLVSLAFTIHSNPGTYALLLGSGISRSSGVPTGWEIVIDLINKLALLQKEDCLPSPEQWYLNKYKKEPDYSEILEDIVKTPVERSQLLKSYFEPNQDEKEKGLKIPTIAHKNIAKLVAEGYFKVIITTNFDRLLEKALEEIGITPIIISTPDAAEGAIPLIHSNCTIVKVHGDYLDTRIKNTQKELDVYDTRINTLLDRIFDEFGLLVCGWSAEWDKALFLSMERCKNYRFSTYWTVRTKLNDSAKKLAELRKAELISIKSSDSVFQDLTEKVLALKDLSQPHPLSSKIAVATVKKYLVDDKYRINLHDLILTETEKVYSEIVNNPIFSTNIPFSDSEFNNRVKSYESLVEVLRDVFIAGCYHGDEKHVGVWVNSLERLVNYTVQGGFSVWINLRLYPSLILLYSAGLAAITARKYNIFAQIMIKPEIYLYNSGKNEPIILHIPNHKVIGKDLANKLPGQDRKYTPLSEHLFQLLKNALREYIPDERRFDETFDRFEYLRCLIHADFKERKANTNNFWGPIGRFGWKYHDGNFSTIIQLNKDIEEQGSNSTLIKTGLFSGSIERFKQVRDGIHELIEKLQLF